VYAFASRVHVRSRLFDQELDGREPRVGHVPVRVARKRLPVPDAGVAQVVLAHDREEVAHVDVGEHARRRGAVGDAVEVVAQVAAAEIGAQGFGELRLHAPIEVPSTSTCAPEIGALVPSTVTRPWIAPVVCAAAAEFQSWDPSAISKIDSARGTDSEALMLALPWVASSTTPSCGREGPAHSARPVGRVRVVRSIQIVMP
jgi:hypothetical protein